MLISYFTPTHNPKWLLEAYKSLQDQTYTTWQWVLVPNGGCSIPGEITADSRVRVVPVHATTKAGIGALKRLACDNCDGEYLAELDHDDFLVRTANERLRAVAEKTKPGFIFSESVAFYPDQTSRIYEDRYGWEKLKYTHENGQEYTAMKSFEVTPRSLQYIYWAPNHIRVWERETYKKVGGHDPALEVGDDHDLVCRTYISGASFEQIPEVLYFYREHPEGNTYTKRGAEIQAQTEINAKKYTYDILEEWCRRKGLKKVDIGSAMHSRPGYEAIHPTEGHIKHDPAWGPLPYQDNTVGCVRVYDYLQRIPRERVVPLMNEIYRVLVPGGWLITKTPSTDGRGAFQDPSHVSFWNDNSFWYYTKRQYANWVPEIKCRFQAARVWNDYPNDWHRKHNIVYTYAELVALKGQRQPGQVEI